MELVFDRSPMTLEVFGLKVGQKGKSPTNAGACDWISRMSLDSNGVLGSD